MSNTKTPDVIDMVKAQLEAGGFDGLFNPNPDCCACLLTDLAPCGEVFQGCRAGYKQPCPPDCGDHDWHVGAVKPAESTQCSCGGLITETGEHAMNCALYPFRIAE